MFIKFSKPLTKSFKKLDLKIQKAFYKKLEIFMTDEYTFTLHNHALQGKYQGVRSISVTGDFRAHYVILSDDVRYFVAIGSHSELYES